ncbi:MAG: nickel pincer cofactor biosynthesis protein LarB, partial [Thermodesulfobacteriota bacterium]
LKKIFKKAVYNETARTLFIKTHKIEKTGRGTILIISAGTSDVPVAEEAALTAEYMGNTVERLYDVGVAGIHRLMHQKDLLFSANVLVVVAGMEGALPSVVAGLVSRPVVAVPTSVGYGANLGGLTTLLAMLNSCAGGISVVNIDNGFGAAVVASRINSD